jgi:hypothetical protein
MALDIKPIELYIDKNFLNAFFVNIKSIDERYSSDIQSFFSSVRNFDLLTNYSNWEELKETQNVLIRSLVNTKVPNKIIYGFELSAKTGLKEKDFILNDSPFKLFFIEDDCSRLTNRLGYDAISSSTINNRWRIYYSKREEIKMVVTEDPSVSETQRFDSWKKLKQFNHPIHSIVIFDKYILCDKSNQKLKNNLFPLLANLIRSSPSANLLDVVIVTQSVPNVPNILEDLHQKISQKLATITNGKNFSLKIVLYSKQNKTRNSQGLKARRIYTNYFVVSADDSFLFFNERDKAENNLTNIEFEFLFKPSTFIWVSKELKEIKNYLSLIKNQPAQGYAPAQIMYYPEDNKINRLLS